MMDDYNPSIDKLVTITEVKGTEMVDLRQLASWLRVRVGDVQGATYLCTVAADAARRELLLVLDAERGHEFDPAQGDWRCMGLGLRGKSEEHRAALMRAAAYLNARLETEGAPRFARGRWGEYE